jgi:hypothetical protein
MLLCTALQAPLQAEVFEHGMLKRLSSALKALANLCIHTLQVRTQFTSFTSTKSTETEQRAQGARQPLHPHPTGTYSVYFLY